MSGKFSSPNILSMNRFTQHFCDFLKTLVTFPTVQQLELLQTLGHSKGHKSFHFLFSTFFGEEVEWNKLIFILSVRIYSCGIYCEPRWSVNVVINLKDFPLQSQMWSGLDDLKVEVVQSGSVTDYYEQNLQNNGFIDLLTVCLFKKLHLHVFFSSSIDTVYST